MVAVGGARPPQGMIFGYGNYENVLYDIRSKMLETQEIQTRAAYLSTPLNYGDIESEMVMERDLNVTTPNRGAVYNLRGGTPMFIESMRADSVKYVGLVSASVAAGTFRLPLTDLVKLYVGAIVEINGTDSTVTAINAGTGDVSVAPPLGGIPSIGSIVNLQGNDFHNPHLTAVHRVTDKYGSFGIDDNRYQVDRQRGLIRYRPSSGTVANSIWHPDAQVGTPYYFGKAMPVVSTPPPAGPGAVPGPDDGVAGNEQLGIASDVAATGLTSDIALPGFNATTQTNFGLPAPDGDYTNIIIDVPAGVAVEVELNGAKLAIAHTGGQIRIPFFDPDHTNDHLKANQGIDPDIYIQRFIKPGLNHLSIKATETTASAGANGIAVSGIFNGINLATNASATSVDTLDWSTSKHSVLGIAGKVNFKLGDRIAMENVNDEVNKAQGVLESLTTIIAGTDVNQLTSLLSVIK